MAWQQWSLAGFQGAHGELCFPAGAEDAAGESNWRV
jgi:hypothetical protein